jgi:hypothetical protein
LKENNIYAKIHISLNQLINISQGLISLWLKPINNYNLMTLRSYIILMIVATLACYLGLGAIIFFFDPFVSGFWALILFYASLFLALVGTFSLIGLVGRLILTKDNLVFKKVTTSFRQGLWLSILACVSLYLNKIKLFDWRYLLPLILALVLLELFFISYKLKPSSKI